MGKKRKSRSKAQIVITFLAIALVITTSLFATLIPGSILNPFDQDDDNGGGGGGGGGDIDKENVFELHHEEINENYTFIFNAHTINSRSELSIEIEDYSTEYNKYFIFLSGYVKENSYWIANLHPGITNLVRIHNFTGYKLYMVSMDFFDRINGNRVTVTHGINNLTMIEGNMSNYIEDPVDSITTTSGSVDLRGEYTESNSNFNNVNYLLHMNETTNAGLNAIDSSYNHYTVNVTDSDLQMLNDDGKFMTNCFDFDFNDYLQVNTKQNYSNQFTCDTWFLRLGVPSQNTNQTIYYRQDSIQAGIYRLTGSNYGVFFSIQNQTGARQTLRYPYNIISNKWYHVAFVTRANLMQIYLDGVNVANRTVTGLNIKDVPYYPTIDTNLANNRFEGRLDELRVLNETRTIFYPANYFPIEYQDGYYFEFESDISNKITFEFSSNASLVSNNHTIISILANFTTSTILNTTLLEAFNFTSNAWTQFNLESNAFLTKDFQATNGTVKARLLLNASIAFEIQLNLLIFRLFYEHDVNDTSWSLYSDNARITLFQNTTTNRTTFELDFDVDEPYADIFESITYFEFSLSQGISFDDLELKIYLFNFTSNTWIEGDILFNLQNVSNDLLLQVYRIPYLYFDDIISSGQQKDRISFLFEFSSLSSTILLDYIAKEIFYMDSNDTTSLTEDFKVYYYVTH